MLKTLITIFFATDSNPQLCALLKTALLNGHDIHVVGWNLNRSSTKKNKVLIEGKSLGITQVTPLVVSSHVCSLERGTVVLGADAYDTLFSSQSTPTSILNTYNTFESDFVWSAENNMWPRKKNLPDRVRRHYDRNHRKRSQQSLYRYLNYGGWIGKVENACKILKLVAKQLVKCDLCQCTKSSRCKTPFQDQGAAHIVYASRFGHNTLLDQEQRIFHPAYPSCEDLNVSEVGEVDVKNISKLTHMYHFNGGAKYNPGCKGYYEHGWFANLGKPDSFEDSVTFVGNKNEKYVLSASKICPYIWLQNFTWIEPSIGQKTWQISIRDKVFESYG